MEAWNAAKLILDVSFGVIVTLTIVIFLYFRERRVRTLIANYVADNAQQEVTAPELVRDPSTDFSEKARYTEKHTQSPPLLARYQASNPSGTTAIANSRKSAGMSRTEKYLEAVRMYRDGRRRDEIESSLGISFMELELLGQLK